jgi:hypothetical protein
VLVPYGHEPAALVVAKDADGGDIEQQLSGHGDFEVKPGHRDRAQDVAVRERQHTTFYAIE